MGDNLPPPPPLPAEKPCVEDPQKKKQNAIISALLILFIIILSAYHMYQMSIERALLLRTLWRSYCRNLELNILCGKPTSGHMIEISQSLGKYSSPKYRVQDLTTAILSLQDNTLTPDTTNKTIDKVYEIMTSKGFTNEFATTLTTHLKETIITKNEESLKLLENDLYDVATMSA